MEQIYKYSNPKIVFQRARKIFGNDVQISLSTRKYKKYMILNPQTQKWIHFGQLGYEDFTKHHNLKRRENYLKRTQNIRGNWESNPYSPNFLSRNLLW